jgi:hypothetical protein
MCKVKLQPVGEIEPRNTILKCILQIRANLPQEFVTPSPPPLWLRVGVGRGSVLGRAVVTVLASGLSQCCTGRLDLSVPVQSV